MYFDITIYSIFDEESKVIHLAIFAHDTAKQVQINAQLHTLLAEKEVLLKEISNRVKNSLQIIASLLSLQSESFTNPQMLNTFTESQNRVRLMALVHEQLYNSDDLARINFSH